MANPPISVEALHGRLRSLTFRQREMWELHIADTIEKNIATALGLTSQGNINDTLKVIYTKLGIPRGERDHELTAEELDQQRQLLRIYKAETHPMCRGHRSLLRINSHSK